MWVSCASCIAGGWTALGFPSNPTTLRIFESSSRISSPGQVKDKTKTSKREQSSRNPGNGSRTQQRPILRCYTWEKKTVEWEKEGQGVERRVSSLSCDLLSRLLKERERTVLPSQSSTEGWTGRSPFKARGELQLLEALFGPQAAETNTTLLLAEVQCWLGQGQSLCP